MADTPQDAETAAREALRGWFIQIGWDILDTQPVAVSTEGSLLHYGNAASVIASALRPASSPGEVTWQPIASAPRDGTRLWLYFPHMARDDRQKVGWWETDDQYNGEYWTDSADTEPGEPTHWRLLPLPPALLSTTQTEAGNGR